MSHIDKVKFIVPVEGPHHALSLDNQIVTVDVSTGHIVTVVPIPSKTDIDTFAQQHPDPRRGRIS